MTQIPGQPALQGQDHFTIVPSDTVNILADTTNNPKGYGSCRLYIGTGSSGKDLSVVSVEGVTKVYKNVPTGFFPFTVVRVNSTGTTATDILGIV